MQDEFWTQSRLEVEVVGPEGSQRHVLDQPYALLGSSSTCDVVLPDTRLPLRCFVALTTATGLRGVSLVRRSVARFRPIDGERGIRVGRFRVYFRIAAADSDSYVDVDADADADRSDAVQATTSDDHVRAYIRWSLAGRKRYARLKRGQPLLLGRRTPSRICLDDRSISATHLIVYWHAERLWLIDLGSTNGTFIGPDQVRCAAVSSGAGFGVGSTLIKYTQVQSPDPEPNSSQSVGATSAHAGEALQERDVLLAQVDRLQAEADDLRRQLAEVRSELEQWEQQAAALAQSQQRQQEQAAEWDRSMAAQQRELDERRKQLQYSELHLAERTEKWERERAAEIEAIGQEQRAWQHRLQCEWELLQRAGLELNEHKLQWADRLERLTKACEENDRVHAERGSQLQRDAERLLVQRIRLQRQLQRRDQELTQRQLQLEQREKDVLERLAALRSRPGNGNDNGNGRSGKIPVVPRDSDVAKAAPAAAATATVESSQDEQFELANPLLESADFTHLLSKFIIEHQADDDA